MEQPSTGHDSVLLDEVLTYLVPATGKIIVDCTLGRGGHAAEIARRVGPHGQVLAIDLDQRNLEYARQSMEGMPCRFFNANFAQFDEVLDAAGISAVDGILADLGVSTNQLFEDEYGMSFSRDMPLDMRLDRSAGPSAADVVNRMDAESLANVLYELAQERYSRRIARKIVEARLISPIVSTGRLAEIVRMAIPKRGGAPERIDPATRTFLALRMHVNREMENLKRLIELGAKALRRGGRLVVISFQSMEDRLVKQQFRSLEQAGAVRILTGKPVVPSEAETARNPRSRSAKLRAVEKC
ncbi:MAG: 16S rRNA (cytosine(1402)-N(4))-methyltransferase RsmH [Tepidisphaeraceae bacterium]|jgi:16S rRNA (cytosine1402-N4)-methyltransferase